MPNNIISVMIFFITFLSFSSLYSQTDTDTQVKHYERCNNTIQKHEQRLLEDPAYNKRVREQQQFIKKSHFLRNPDCSGGQIIVPVAIHFEDGVVPSGQESCAISLVQDQIDAFNLEINGDDAQNTAYIPLQNCFPGNPPIGESCIALCIATYNHPAGYNLSEGDPAITFGQVDFNNINPSSFAVPIDVNWTGYLNIFVGNLSGGLLGEAAGIPGDFSGEGVVIDACTFGTGNVDCTNMESSASCGGIYNEGNTLTHEIGHYFGLFHIWGDNSICTGSQDQIDDTPNMDSNYSGYTTCSDLDCNDLPESCSSADMYMNYMSYAGDACMYMFTSDQADVMNLSLINAGFSTDYPSQCIAPTSPVASFSFTPDPAILCPGYSELNFIDESSGPASSWNWTFSGAGVSPSSSADKNPTVNVSLAGTLTANLIASNAIGTSQQYTEYISISILSETDPLCDLCDYTLELFDSYGDGWNGAELEVKLDDITQGIYSISNGVSATFSIPVLHNQDIELIFSGGSYDSEVSFDLKDPFDYVLYHQGPSPPDGVLYSSLVNCNTPTCSDGIMNGEESGIDCGGQDCPDCPVCGTTFYDSGGSGGNYSNNENLNWTFCPDNPGEKIKISFNSFDIENHSTCNYDKLSIYNGTGTSELIDEFCGTTIPDDIVSTSSDGCLYIVFESDTYISNSGWEAIIECELPCTYVTNTGDSGIGTLREAINCSTTGDTIKFMSLLNGDTIYIDNSLLIDKNITILGGVGQNILIKSNEIAPLLHNQSSGVLLLEGITLFGKGDFSSPILKNNGSLTLKNVTIHDLAPQGSFNSIENEENLWIEENVKILKE